MRHPATSANETPLRRRSYTLVELLLVIAIITVLIGLSVSALFQFIVGQHEKNTKFMMTQLSGQLNKQFTAVAQTAKDENRSAHADANTLATIQQWAGGDDPRARVMYVKFRLKQEFPTSFDEALNPAPLKANPTYAAYLNKFGITGSSAATAPYESSACLYMALTLSRSGTEFKVDQLGLAVREFDLPNGKKIKGFTDDWTNPLVFARWPWADPNLQTLNPVQNSLMNDKDDPDGQLLNNTWQANNLTTGVAAFQQYAHPVTNPPLPANNAQPYAYYLIPVLVSGGRDNNLGINPADFATLKVSTPSAAGDNIYSYNLGRN